MSRKKLLILERYVKLRMSHLTLNDVHDKDTKIDELKEILKRIEDMMKYE